jgi:hypothetical protein
VPEELGFAGYVVHDLPVVVDEPLEYADLAQAIDAPVVGVVLPTLDGPDDGRLQGLVLSL